MTQEDEEVEVVDRIKVPHVIRLIVVAPLLATAGAFFSAGTATADPCPPLDLGCTVAPTTDPVGGTTTGSAGTVSETVTETGGAVGGTVTDTGGAVGGTVGGPVGGTVTETTATVGGIVSQTSGTLGGVAAQAGGGAGGVVTHADGTTPSTISDVPLGDSTGGGETTPTGGGGNESSGGATISGSTSGGTRGPASRVATSTSTVGISSSATPSGPRPRDLSDVLQSFVRGALAFARTVAFPIALVVVVIGFLFVQGWIDRKDPKLALAPVDSEYLTFS